MTEEIEKNHNQVYWFVPNDNIQLMTSIEVTIRIYHSKKNYIYRGFSRGKYHFSWNVRSLYKSKYKSLIVFLYDNHGFCPNKYDL